MRNGASRRAAQPGGGAGSLKKLLTPGLANLLQQPFAGELLALLTISQVEQQDQREVDRKHANRENEEGRHNRASFKQAFR